MLTLSLFEFHHEPLSELSVLNQDFVADDFKWLHDLEHVLVLELVRVVVPEEVIHLWACQVARAVRVNLPERQRDLLHLVVVMKQLQEFVDFHGFSFDVAFLPVLGNVASETGQILKFILLVLS